MTLVSLYVRVVCTCHTHPTSQDCNYKYCCYKCHGCCIIYHSPGQRSMLHTDMWGLLELFHLHKEVHTHVPSSQSYIHIQVACRYLCIFLCLLQFINMSYYNFFTISYIFLCYSCHVIKHSKVNLKIYHKYIIK